MFNLKTVGRRLDCAREKFEYRRTRKRGVGRADCPVGLLCQGAVMAVSYNSFDRFREFESDRWNDGIALAAYWQLGKPMFKEQMKEVCHEGTYGFWRKPN
jgi:hypothetical protein